MTPNQFQKAIASQIPKHMKASGVTLAMTEITDKVIFTFERIYRNKRRKTKKNLYTETFFVASLQNKSFADLRLVIKAMISQTEGALADSCLEQFFEQTK